LAAPYEDVVAGQRTIQVAAAILSVIAGNGPGAQSTKE
jgi:hypothetical protein